MNNFKIVKMSTASEADICTRIMAESDPWLTLNLTYENLMKIFDDPDNLTFIAKESGEILGFVVVNMKGTFKGYIKILAVNSNIRSKGIGTKLMDFAENHIFEQTPNVFICVSHFNEKAQKFYFSRGFKLIGTIENFFNEGLHELFLRKTIGTISNFRK